MACKATFLVVLTRSLVANADALEIERDEAGFSGLTGVAVRLGREAGELLRVAEAEQLGVGGGGMLPDKPLWLATDG